MKRACKDCEFYQAGQIAPEWAPTTGACHRRPPQFYVEKSNVVACSSQPPVSENDWCGEFQPREEEKPAKTCKTCRYWSVGATQCVRTEPWPANDDETGCGGFEKKEQER